jgi:hypothetical protein
MTSKPVGVAVDFFYLLNDSFQTKEEKSLASVSFRSSVKTQL